MREGRRRPSLAIAELLAAEAEATAMREGRRRPSLFRIRSRNRASQGTAMREGRRRPSLGIPAAGRLSTSYHRNEGGAPAPLVADGFPDSGKSKSDRNEGGAPAPLVAI